MSILNDIVRRVSPGTDTAPASRSETPPHPATESATAQAGVNPEILAQQASSNATPTGQSVQAMHSRKSDSAAVPRTNVDAAFNELVRRKSANLDWRGSIVDLLELLDLDSSPETRKTLADELDYTGDRNDMATMDAWLHQEVMRRLNGRMS